MTIQAPLVNAGDVIEVQLTSETVIIEDADRRHVEPGHITNRLRLFVRETDGREQKYDFEDTELGVRETQRVAVVRGHLRKRAGPVNLILYNLSSGERDTFEAGLAAYLGRKARIGARWKAAGFALLVGVAFWAVSNYLERGGQGGAMSVFLAAMFGFLTYPIFWWVCGTWDRISERMRYRAARKRFLSEMDARVRTYAPLSESSASAAAAPAQARRPDPPAAEPSPA